MTHIEHSVLINRPVDQVYAYVSDPRNDPQWQTGINETTIVGDAPITSTYTFASEGEGTRVNAVVDLEASGFFKLAEGMLTSSANKEMEQSLATLKSKLES